MARGDGETDDDPRREQGQVTALSVHAGIWTSAALSAPPSEVPCLRAQLSEMGAKFGFDPAGHAGKALVHALTTLPHDLLVSFSDADVERLATATMSLTDRPRPKLAPARRNADVAANSKCEANRKHSLQS